MAVWRGMFPMTTLMVVVIGSIFAGWATPTESGAVGVFGSMLIAALNGRLTIKMLSEAVFQACRANALVFLIFLGATGFSYVFRVLGGDDLMTSTLVNMGVDTAWEMLAFVMVLDLSARLSVRMDRDLPDRPADLRADPDEVRLLRASRQPALHDGVVRYAGRGQSADRVHDAAVWRHAVLHERNGAARA